MSSSFKIHFYTPLKNVRWNNMFGLITNIWYLYKYFTRQILCLSICHFHFYPFQTRYYKLIIKLGLGQEINKNHNYIWPKFEKFVDKKLEFAYNSQKTHVLEYLNLEKWFTDGLNFSKDKKVFFSQYNFANAYIRWAQNVYLSFVMDWRTLKWLFLITLVSLNCWVWKKRGKRVDA